MDRLVAAVALRFAAAEKSDGAGGSVVAEDPAAPPGRIGPRMKSGEQQSAERDPPDVEKYKAPRRLFHAGYNRTQ
jgi:hypothetical protein